MSTLFLQQQRYVQVAYTRRVTPFRNNGALPSPMEHPLAEEEEGGALCEE